MRSLCFLLLVWFAVVGACTPEAVEVDPPCAPISSPRQTCTDCIPTQCPTQVSACQGEGNACTCGNFGGYQGQINCLLACQTLSPKMNAANACASQCGFGSLANSDPTTHQLFDCLVNPPMGPPVCPECFPVH